MSTAEDADGGYYAIKGFLYQFDKTIFEVLSNPDKVIAFETVQDINWDEYVIQVKHKETQNFAPSKIRKPVVQLLNSFKEDQRRKLRLYCHFADKAPSTVSLDLDQLDVILGEPKVSSYEEALKKAFVLNFEVRYSENYQAQFEAVVDKIKAELSLGDSDTAIVYHSIIVTYLQRLSLEALDKRQTSCVKVKEHIAGAERSILTSAYIHHVNADRLIKVIKSLHFTFKTPNIDKVERVFVVERRVSDSLSEAASLLGAIARKYFRKSKSPQPFAVLRGFDAADESTLKRILWDKGIHFFDGTHFHGDRVREAELIISAVDHDRFVLKVLPVESLEFAMKNLNYVDVYQLYRSEPLTINVSGKHVKVQVDSNARAIALFE